MPAPITINKKPVAATICDGLDSVSTTLSITPEKDQDSALISLSAAYFKPRA